jgi:hypothetical protein
MVSLEKQTDPFAQWLREGDKLATTNLYDYLTTLFGRVWGSSVYRDLYNNNPNAFSEMLQLHFRYDNVTGELTSHGRV